MFFMTCSVCALKSPLPMMVPDASTASCPPTYTVLAGPVTTTTFVKAGFLFRESGLMCWTWPFKRLVSDGWLVISTSFLHEVYRFIEVQPASRAALLSNPALIQTVPFLNLDRRY